MADIQACTDHGCIYGHPGGMGTNGGCKCLYELPLEKRRRAATNIRTLRARLEQAQAERNNLAFRNDSLREQTTQLLIQRDNLVIKEDGLKATIARQRAWIESAGHRPGCAANHCAVCMWDAGYHSSGTMREPHDFQPGPCGCGFAELVGG